MTQATISRKWHTTAEVAEMLGFSLSRPSRSCSRARFVPSRSDATAAFFRPGWTST